MGPSNRGGHHGPNHGAFGRDADYPLRTRSPMTTELTVLEGRIEGEVSEKEIRQDPDEKEYLKEEEGTE